jgi:hypothetical protein
MKERQSGQKRFLTEVRQLLLVVRYLEVVVVPQGRGIGCDLIAHAPDTIGVPFGGQSFK